jgi:hypothetical protein
VKAVYLKPIYKPDYLVLFDSPVYVKAKFKTAGVLRTSMPDGSPMRFK